MRLFPGGYQFISRVNGGCITCWGQVFGRVSIIFLQLTLFSMIWQGTFWRSQQIFLGFVEGDGVTQSTMGFITIFSPPFWENPSFGIATAGMLGPVNR